jgi:hypothetical protein
MQLGNGGRGHDEGIESGCPMLRAIFVEDDDEFEASR